VKDNLPVLVVGDVHGDLERLFKALVPYPQDAWHTVFLGDLVDYGLFGVGALRYARDRRNSTVVLGNHEVAMLWAMRDPSRVGFWMSIGGQGHDLDELARDPALQQWIRERPALVRLGDGTLVQHCGHDGYLEMADEDSTNVIETVNRRVKEMLQHGQEDVLWTAMSGKNIFGSQPERLRRWLEATQSRRVVFGHTPHNSHAPERYHDGAAINFDGAFSRQHLRRRKQSPIGASVAPLDSVK